MPFVLLAIAAAIAAIIIMILAFCVFFAAIKFIENINISNLAKAACWGSATTLITVGGVLAASVMMLIMAGTAATMVHAAPVIGGAIAASALGSFALKACIDLHDGKSASLQR